jgi:hypothetical protein
MVVKVCWDSNGVDQGVFPVIVGYTQLGTLSEDGYCRDPGDDVRHITSDMKPSFPGVLLQCSTAK